MSMFANDDQLHKPEETFVFAAFTWFHRIIAAYCLLFGFLYWVRLIGYYDGPLWRFDLMPLHWQFASASLAVLFPVAAIGLWMKVSWGPVIWLAAASAETLMFYGFPQLFGAHVLTLAAHLAVAVLYIAFWAAIRHQKRKKPR
jgi:Family of unknown function (DUF6163)